MNSLNEKYPNTFDCTSLCSELKYLYIDSDFKRCKSLHSILFLLYQLELTSAMPETTKFCKLLLTIPLTSVSNERNFLALDRIKTYLRSTMSQDRLTSLALISIQKDILHELEIKQELFEKIFQEFAVKKGGWNFNTNKME